MSKKHSWLMALVVVALLLAACGPQMATPTPPSEEVATSLPPTEAPTGQIPTAEPSASGDLPVDSDDWHVLGAPDAPVTIVEYSDFQ